jgi:prevent-host-death family protein
MASVGVRELRQRASELLRRVAAGETIEVTDRGRPVALLAPIPQAGPLERRRRPLVSSALARAEVARALLPLGAQAVRHGQEVLARLELIRVSDRVLTAAGALSPAELRTLDAIHLATAQQLGSDLASLVTYDERLGAAARAAGCQVSAPV